MAVFPSPLETSSAAQVAEGAPRRAERRALARAALNLADQLLDRLELLSLKGQQEVPDSLTALTDTLRRAAVIAGIERPALDTHGGVLRLMDDVYDVEDELLPRCRRRALPPVPATH